MACLDIIDTVVLTLFLFESCSQNEAVIVLQA